MARQSRVVWAQGAYADIGAVIARNASYCSLGPYRMPHARIDAYLVYTEPAARRRLPRARHPAGGVGRRAADGPRRPRARHRPARAPAAQRVRRRRHERDGRAPRSTWGRGSAWCGRRAASAWERPLSRETAGGRRRGRGIACILKSTLTPTASFGFVKLDGDGSAEVITSAVEHGQGTHTVLAQIAAEELSHSRRPRPLRHARHRRHAVRPLVDVEPHHLPHGQRGPPGRRRRARQLVEMAAAVLEVHAKDLVAADGAVAVRGAPGHVAQLRARSSRSSTARRRASSAAAASRPSRSTTR